MVGSLTAYPRADDAANDAPPVTAVLAGVVTAGIWAAATLLAARASRILGPWSTTSWVVLIGGLATLPLVLADGLPGAGDADEVAILAVVGLGYATGLILLYAALAGGKVPIAAPIVSTEGAIAATLAVLWGEAAGAPLLALLALVVAGVVLTTLEPSGGPADVPAGAIDRHALLAVAAALAFGVSLFAAGRSSTEVPLSWVVAAGRLAGIGLVALPVLLVGRLRLVRAAVPFVLACGLLEVAGYFTFAWGAQDSIAVTAVLASQFAAAAAVVAHLMGERIAPRQWLGVGMVTVSVTAITLLRM